MKVEVVHPEEQRRMGVVIGDLLLGQPGDLLRAPATAVSGLRNRVRLLKPELILILQPTGSRGSG
jgi:hypothetical protein